jgi:hypothetical protein
MDRSRLPTYAESFHPIAGVPIRLSFPTYRFMAVWSAFRRYRTIPVLAKYVPRSETTTEALPVAQYGTQLIACPGFPEVSVVDRLV